MKRTKEQLDEERRFRSIVQADGLGLRVKVDDEGWPYVPGMNGRIETQCGPEYLYVFGTGGKTRQALLALPGVSKHQIGDHEWRLKFTFKIDVLAQVCGVIRARLKKKSISKLSMA